LHRSVQVCFCEDDAVKKPFECNEEGLHESSARKFPFMNTVRMDGKQTSSGMESGNSLETLANLDPSALKEMEDYSFTADSGMGGAHPMTVNVHFDYPRNYRERIENGAFGAGMLAEDNVMGEDGEYDYYEYGAYDHFDGYDDEMDIDQVMDDGYSYYAEHYGENEGADDHVFVYQDDEEENGWDSEDGAAAYINIEYDSNVVDDDMRISIEKGSNEYVPYVNPDVSGFGQRVRISWNTFWTLQLLAIVCGVALFMAIALYFHSPFHFPSAMPLDSSYGHAKSLDHCDDSMEFDEPQLDEVEQLKE